MEAAAFDTEKNNLLWELIGDLSLKQNKPDEALSAYTRAISKLIRK
jgi:predicted negative regulator of RcsB-dependent stress response